MVAALSVNAAFGTMVSEIAREGEVSSKTRASRVQIVRQLQPKGACASEPDVPMRDQDQTLRSLTIQNYSTENKLQYSKIRLQK